MRQAGKHFFQVPGPSAVPDRSLKAIDQPTINHRRPDLAPVGKKALAGMKLVFRTERDVFLLPSSGPGAALAAMPCLKTSE
ncbi:hypothetical protein [Meridianimarinicoccus sp. MJW13]|uniref:hypothetical protein n=1 Tax=Meridianimarinicoccus sp. MJW13 TaxID=2720031 RepID=UPI0018692BB7|nr:hypothetical protein [Fluviibacterium sp. MJW13]